MAEFPHNYKKFQIAFLAEKIHEEGTSLLKETHIDIKITEAYLRRVFNRAGSLADVAALLPERVRPLLGMDQLPPKSDHAELTLTKDEIAAFLQENEEDYDRILQRAMLIFLDDKK